MSQSLFVVEKGLRIVGANSNSGVDHLFGSAAPGGDAGEQDAAAIGSTYQRTSGELYVKKASANVAADWIRIATLDDVFGLAWRSERVIAATGQAAPASGGTIDFGTSPFSDDEGTQLDETSFVVNDHVIFGVGGTVKLMRVSNIAGSVVTFVDAADPIADNDTFIVRNYLPDSPDAQEAQAIVTYNGTAIVKISDFNWALADGINLPAGYSGAANGDPTAGDTVSAAIGKLDANVDDLTTLSGEAQGAVNHGSFTGYTIPDNQTTKQALQALETGLEARAQATGVTAAATVDSVLVDDVKAVEWEIHAFEEATPANAIFEKIVALHNGTASADATSTDFSAFAKVKVGANFNLTLDVDLNGVGAAQAMRLRASSSTAGVTVTVRRIIVR